MEEEVKKKRSPIVSNTLNPPWYCWLDFGVSDWGWFTVQAFDNSGEKLCYRFTYVLSIHVGQTNEKKKALQGNIFFDYVFSEA